MGEYNLKQVNVLLSTYNGEKYLEEQVESIVNQTYENIKIFIRDDGSTDHTIQRLYALQKKYKLVIVEGSNIGYGKSFMKLLEIAKEGDFWAFADQDDIWFPNKVKWAVEWMEQEEDEIPLLFHSSYELVNEDLSRVIGVYSPPKYKINFQRALTDSVYQGFSIILNRKLREMLLQCNINNITSHDWLAGILVEKFGKAKFDERIACSHRRTEESISSMALKNRIKWFYKTMQGNSDIRTTAKEFDRVFGKKINDRECKMARWFTHDTYSIKDVLKKAFFYKRWRQSLSSEIAVRLLMLLNKI